MKIFTSARAQDDLLRIYRYLVDRNPQAADDLFREIDARFKNLGRFPFIGRERSSLAPGLRSVLVGTYLIFYVVQQ
jgi:toxin ParE1/3/4